MVPVMLRSSWQSVIDERLRRLHDNDIKRGAAILCAITGLTLLLLALPAPPRERTVNPYTTDQWAEMVARYGLDP